jgi:hypothetical protein
MCLFLTGDTWMFGSASDPLKMAQHRALQRVWADCLASPNATMAASCALENSPVMQNFSWYLLKGTEHTWGGAGLPRHGQTVASDTWGQVGEFEATALRNETLLRRVGYMSESETYAEQRYLQQISTEIPMPSRENAGFIKPNGKKKTKSNLFKRTGCTRSLRC